MFVNSEKPERKSETKILPIEILPYFRQTGRDPARSCERRRRVCSVVSHIYGGISRDVGWELLLFGCCELYGWSVKTQFAWDSSLLFCYNNKFIFSNVIFECHGYIFLAYVDGPWWLMSIPIYNINLVCNALYNLRTNYIKSSVTTQKK